MVLTTAESEKRERMEDGEVLGLLMSTVDMRLVDVIYKDTAANFMEVLSSNLTTTDSMDMKRLSRRVKGGDTRSTKRNLEGIGEQLEVLVDLSRQRVGG